ncbi:MAG: carbohydrate ABC transporter permease [Roseburia sp.]|nr:carbohydrate ABC transporter permease [Roseburia sp.]
MNRKMSKGEKVFQVINYTLLLLLIFVCIYPMWYVVVCSFSDSWALMGHRGILLWPLKFTVVAYERVFSNELIWKGYTNTIVLLAVGLFFQMIMTILGAYFFSRPNVLYRRPLMLMITFTMFFGGGLIPTYLNIRDFNLDGTMWGLVIPFCISTFNMIILRTSFESIPSSLTEAAQIDGASHWTVLWKIVLPLSKATLAVIALYYGVGTWNSWFWATVLLRDRSKLPLQAILRHIIVSNAMDGMDSGMPASESIKYAAITVATVPILCVYPFLQKYFTQGVMIGAVKE